LAGSELTGWSMRKKSGTAPSSLTVGMLLSRAIRSRASLRGAERRSNLDQRSLGNDEIASLRSQ
jgi:hypothetical protein